MHTILQQWLNTACEQIAWKQARPIVAQELTDHLTEQYLSFTDQGNSPEEAAQKTVAEMGNPIEIGTELSRSYRPKTDFFLVGIVLFVAFVGMAVQYVISFAATDYTTPHPLAVLLTYCVGVLCFFAAYFFDYTLLLRRTERLFLVFLVLCFLPAMDFFSFGMGFFFDPFDYHIALGLFLPLLFSALLFHLQQKTYKSVLAIYCFFTVFILLNLCGITNTFFYLFICFLLLCEKMTKPHFFPSRKKQFLAMIFPLVCFLVVVQLLLVIFWGKEGLPILPEVFVAFSGDIDTNTLHSFLQGNLTPYDSTVQEGIIGILPYRNLLYLKGTFGILWLLPLLLLGFLFLRCLFQKQTNKETLAPFPKQIFLTILLTLSLETIHYALSNAGIYIPPFDSMLPFFSYTTLGLCSHMLLMGIFLSALRLSPLHYRQVTPSQKN